MRSLGLLHIAQSAVNVTTVNPMVVAAALAALVAALAAIWLPRSGAPLRYRMSRRSRRRAVSVVAAAFVFLALLPSVLPYDHLFGDAHPSGAQAADKAEAVHASHCHVGPATCSDAPITAGPGQLLLSDALIVEPSMLAMLVATAATVLIGISFRPEVRPPLSLAA